MSRLRFSLLLATLTMLVAVPAAQAASEGPGWELSATTYPTNLIPEPSGQTSGTIAVDVFNIGAGAAGGTITVTDTLPAGLRAREAGDLRTVGEFFKEKWGLDPLIEHSLWDCAGNEGGPVEGATVVTCVNDPVNLPSIQGGGGVPGGGSPVEGANPQPPIGITVQAPSAASGLLNHVTIAGGGAPAPASTHDPITVSSEPAPPGLTGWDTWFSNADGTPDTQAGSHPYEMTTVFDLATALNGKQEGELSGGEVRDLEVQLPPGFLGDLRGFPQCSRAQLASGETGICPQASEVGILKAETLNTGITHPIFNMVPPPGQPAEFGFKFGGVSVFIDFTVRSGGDYGITAHVNDLAQREAVQGIVTLWGVPEDKSHNIWRGGGAGGCTQQQIETSPLGKDEEEYCTAPQHPVVKPVLTLPTGCGETEPSFLIRELNGWQEPAAKSELSSALHDSNGRPAQFTGCEDLAFEPTITTSPDTARADTPTGLTVEVTPPTGGLEEPGLLGTSDIQNTTVTLPPGLVINPGQAAGLQACRPGNVEGGDDLPLPGENGNEEQFAGPAKCPGASKVGTVEIDTPLIESSEQKVLKGEVYVLQSNPPEIKLLLAASADGVNLKLVGKASLCEATGEMLDGKTCEAPGQLITKFENTPQLPFTLFKLSFSGGAQAALDTPTQCGSYTSNADFTPWSSPFISSFETNAAFEISEGPNGSSCPSWVGGPPLPFSPSLTAGSTTDQAGGFTDFSMLLQRGDGQQRIEKLSFKAPQGLSGMISQVPLCDEADANAGTCPAASKIGHAVVTSGPGSYPLVLPQPGEPELPIYLTGPYKGAPFGLSIVTPVLAGPFDLGTIVTRASIAVDAHTAQITVTTDPLPQIVKGVPTDLRSIDAVIDRSGFMFNPTNCNTQSFSGTATSAGGVANAALSTPFGVGSCQSLKFAPKFAVSTPAKASKAEGAGLTVKLTYPKAAQGTQANIREVKVDLPKQLPSQLKTLQKACLAATFEANPLNCPKHSVVGEATVTTPLLPVPLTGKAYFVSHGGEAFPSLTMVLQGDNVTIDLVGSTYIHGGITSSTFKTVPDVPFSTFTLTLNQGEYAALAANLPAKAKHSFCGQKLTMPTAFVGQNGAEIHESTKISVEGCSSSLSFTHSIKQKTVTLSVYAPAAGKLTAGGKGLITQTKTAKGPEDLTFTLEQKHAGKLKTTVKVSYTPGTGKDRKKQSKSAKLTFKK